MKIGLVLILALALLLVSCAIPSQGDDSCKELEGTAQDNCYFEALKCSKISAEVTRDTCVVELAKLKKDATVCNLVVTPRVKSYCQEQMAETLNNHSLCSEVTDEYWENNFHFHLAINNNKDIYCSLISVENQQEE